MKRIPRNQRPAPVSAYRAVVTITPPAPAVRTPRHVMLWCSFGLLVVGAAAFLLWVAAVTS